MLKIERYDKIVQMVNARGITTVEELCEALHVSKATIRRDLVQLDEDQVVTRTHGGAMKCNKSITAEVPLYLRVHMQKAEKELVAAEAVKQIEEGATIYIGAGTTGQALASKLGGFHHLTVVTNDIDSAKAVSCTDNSLMVVGGQLKPETTTLYGMFAEQILKELTVDVAFMAVDAVDVNRGFMDFGIDEVNIKRLVLANAHRCYMMCDFSKFEKSAFVTVCPLSEAYAVITNTGTDRVKTDKLAESGLKVIFAEDEH